MGTMQQIYCSTHEFVQKVGILFLAFLVLKPEYS